MEHTLARILPERGKEELSPSLPGSQPSEISTLRQAQMVMLRILRAVDALCRQHNITYWLHTGTLLGAVRHGGFIPWDDDLDIVMPRNEFHRFFKIAQQELPEDLFLQTAETDPAYPYTLPKVRDKKSRLVESTECVPYCQGIFIDVFPFDSYPNRTVLSFLTLLRRLLDYRRKFSKGSVSRLLYMIGLNTIGLPLVLTLYAFEGGAKRWRDLIFNKPSNNFITHGVELYYEKTPYEKEDIFPLKEINFEGYTFFRPR